MRKPIPFGKYYLLERISVGGMAEVFKAKVFGVEGFEKILALKRILPTMAEDEEFIEMFVDEAKIAGQLSHANVCQIYELGCVDDTHFIAMEFIHGKDILQIQNRFRKMKRHMPAQMAAFIASKVCEGLDYAHSKKDANGNPLHIIHRDVSPQNVLVSYEGEVKVIDFGIAKAANRSNKTQAGILKGKFGYMSPEQVRGLPLDRRSDIFAVGTVMYEMLTGERLFVGESDFSTLEKVRHVDVPLPTEVNPKIPPELEAVIMKALTKNVEERYQSGNDMADDLNRYLMSCEPMYSAKRLSHWMKTTFADDLAKDLRKMEAFRQIGPNGVRPDAKVIPPPPAVPAFAPVEEVDKTEVWGDDDIPLMDIGEADVIEEGSEEEIHAGATMLFDHEVDGPVGDQATMLFDTGSDGLPGDLAGEKTMLFDNEAGGDVASLKTQMVASPLEAGRGGDLQAQKTMLFDTSTQDPAMLDAPRASVPAPSAFSPMGQQGAYAQPGAYGAPAGVRVVALPPPRSSIARDILLAMVVGFVAVVGVIIAFTYLQPGDETVENDAIADGEDGKNKGDDDDGDDGSGADKEESGLVITTKPTAREAEVFVNGERRCVEVPCFVRDVEDGTARIKIMADDYEPFEGKVEAEEGKRVEYEAVLKPRPKGKAKLKIVVDKKGADITINGKPYTEKSGFVELGAGSEHAIVVKKVKFATIEKSVELEKGDEKTVELKLEPAKLTLKIDSKPVGGLVQLDGEKLGVTPLERGGLDIDRIHLITITADGYKSFKKKVKYEGEDVVTIIAELEEESAATVKPGGKPTGKPTGKPSGKPATGAADASGKPKTSAPKPDAKGFGFLVANSRPFAKILVDGKSIGRETPIGPPGHKISAGTHKITFRLPDGRDVSYTVEIKKDETIRLIKNLE